MQTTEDARVGVIAIGNIFVSDDGVGIRALRRFREAVADERVALIESERGGMDLLDRLEGLDAVLIVDAAQTGRKSPGEIAVFAIRAPFTPGESPSLHTIDLRGLLAFGGAMGMPLPREVTVLTVEAEDIETFQEVCTRNVERAIPEVVDRLVKEVRRILPDVQMVSCRGDAAVVG
jgi:hydrogenase maturation protease